MKLYKSPDIDIYNIGKTKILVELLLWSDNDVPVDEDEDTSSEE